MCSTKGKELLQAQSENFPVLSHKYLAASVGLLGQKTAMLERHGLNPEHEEPKSGRLPDVRVPPSNELI